MVKSENRQPREIQPKIPRTPEEYERMNVALAMRLSTERLREGTASAQEILYWLKVGSPETQLQREYLQSQITLNESKVKEIEGARNDELLYSRAMKALGGYRGTSEEGIFDGDFEDIDD